MHFAICDKRRASSFMTTVVLPRSWALLIIIGMLVGCGNRAAVGGFDDSPDGKYRVYCRIFGAFGHSFSDKTEKTVRVSVVLKDNDEPLLFRREYTVWGSDVGVDTSWGAQEDISGVIFDYGPGVTFGGDITNEPPRRIISKFKYRFDKQTRKFVEESASESK